MASVASYADDVRNTRPETKRWHFVDIPLGKASFSMARDCAPEPEGDCVIAAIARARAALGDRSRPKHERAEALDLLVRWADEAHRAAIEFAYALPDDFALERRRAKGEGRRAYYDRSRPVVDRQLARAGARLGRLSNETLGHQSGV